jgi:hypothetical protein
MYARITFMTAPVAAHAILEIKGEAAITIAFLLRLNIN